MIDDNGKGLQRLDKGSIISLFLDLVFYAMIYNSLCTCKKLEYRKVRFS
jgi:hypothetical protein